MCGANCSGGCMECSPEDFCTTEEQLKFYEGIACSELSLSDAMFSSTEAWEEGRKDWKEDFNFPKKWKDYVKQQLMTEAELKKYLEDFYEN